MKLSIRKSKTIGKVRVNVSKGGASLRLGTRHLGVNLSRRGLRPSLSFFGVRVQL